MSDTPLFPGDGTNFDDANGEIFSEYIDLLVDDELEEDDRKNLLLKLDRMSGGWKRCALVFLEAQMFAKALRANQKSEKEIKDSGETVDVLSAAFSNSVPEKPSTPLVPFLKSGNISSRTNRPSWVGITATSLLAFILGGILFSSLSGKGQNVADSQSDQHLYAGMQTNHTNKGTSFSPIDSGLPSTDARVVAVGRPAERVTSNSDENRPAFLALTAKSTPFVTVIPKNHLKEGTPQTVYVTLPNDEYSGEMRIPCYLSSEIEADQYLKSPPLISSKELHQIFQLGGDINVTRQNYIVPAGEDRHAVIPVDQVVVKYAPQRDML